MFTRVQLKEELYRDHGEDGDSQMLILVGGSPLTAKGPEHVSRVELGRWSDRDQMFITDEDYEDLVESGDDAEIEKFNRKAAWLMGESDA